MIQSPMPEKAKYNASDHKLDPAIAVASKLRVNGNISVSMGLERLAIEI